MLVLRLLGNTRNGRAFAVSELDVDNPKSDSSSVSNDVPYGLRHSCWFWLVGMIIGYMAGMALATKGYGWGTAFITGTTICIIIKVALEFLWWQVLQWLVPPCPLCGTKLFFMRGKLGHPGFHMVCSDCGGLFLHEPPDWEFSCRGKSVCQYRRRRWWGGWDLVACGPSPVPPNARPTGESTVDGLIGGGICDNASPTETVMKPKPTATGPLSQPYRGQRVGWFDVQVVLSIVGGSVCWKILLPLGVFVAYSGGCIGFVVSLCAMDALFRKITIRFLPQCPTCATSRNLSVQVTCYGVGWECRRCGASCQVEGRNCKIILKEGGFILYERTRFLSGWRRLY